MEYQRNKIKMATRVRGKKVDQLYNAFFQSEVLGVMQGAKKPNILTKNQYGFLPKRENRS
jgi:hypothetical protein